MSPRSPSSLSSIAYSIVLILASARIVTAAEHELEGVLDVRLVATDSGWSWLDGGLDKSRFDEDADLVLGRALLEYEGRFSKIVTARATLAVYDDLDGAIDVTEAFLEVKPIPRSSWLWRLRVGAFYPPISLETTDVGWTSPYTLSLSAINTWVGEEIRTLGVEGDLVRAGRFRRSPHDLRLTGSLFTANDPLGALISWRGWSLHDRVTGLAERLPLADLPAFRRGGSFPPQEPYEEPFVEIDHELGYYAGLQWDYLERSRLRVLHYDNRTDPSLVEDGQWSWHSEFDHLGWHFRPSSRTDLIAQVLDGKTLMADYRSRPLVYAHYRSAFLLGSHRWGGHRASVRLDAFEVTDEDSTPDDLNEEEGSALTLAYFFEPETADNPATADGKWWQWRFGVELMLVDAERPARALLGRNTKWTENTLQVSGQLRF